VSNYLSQAGARAFTEAENNALRKTTAPRSGVLRYWLGRYVVGLIAVLLGGGAALWVQFGNLHGEPVWWLAPLFAGFAAMGLYSVVAYHRVRCQLTPYGFRLVPLLSGRALVRWSAVETVAWGRFCHIVFRLRDGRVVRVPADLVGIPWFSAHVLSKIGTSRIEPRAYAALGKLAKGGLAVGFGMIA
jgi:hypothetical protein